MPGSDRFLKVNPVAVHKSYGLKSFREVARIMLLHASSKSRSWRRSARSLKNSIAEI